MQFCGTYSIVPVRPVKLGRLVGKSDHTEYVHKARRPFVHLGVREPLAKLFGVLPFELG